MDNADLKSRLRRALSYRKKAQRLDQECAESLADGDLSPEQCHTLHLFYERHRGHAEAWIAELTEEIERRLAGLTQQLEAKHAEQAGLQQRAASGELTPVAANTANRRLLEAIARLTAESEQLRPLLHALEPERVGGFLDLPIDEYIPKKATPWRKRGRFRTRYVAIPIVLAVVIVLLLTMGNRTKMEFDLRSEPEGTVRIFCRNLGGKPAVVYAPWPDGVPVHDSSFAPSTTFGLAVYIQEKGDTTRRLVRSSPGCWLLRGAFARHEGPWTVLPATTLDVTFVAQALLATGVKPVAVRIVVSRADGQVLKELDVGLSD